MKDKLLIREITSREDVVLPEVNRLFTAMYDHMREHGLMLNIPADGYERWLATALQGPGRFSRLIVCRSDLKVTGFAHAGIRITPDYLGNRKVGVISHVFVEPQVRGRGAGKEMVKDLERWFAEKQVHSVELQVLTKNIPAVVFWEKLGYLPELMQFRKPFIDG
jgi:GNAT superfamily N-acetyltransferase